MGDYQPTVGAIPVRETQAAGVSVAISGLLTDFLLIEMGSGYGDRGTIREPIMSRAEEHHWYGEIAPWTKEQLDDYHRHRGFGLMQRTDITDGGVPPRAQIDAMLARARDTDVPLHWIRELSKARDMLDETEELPDGSERLIALVDHAADIEDRAIQAFLS
jgi:hypothetical protein